MNLKAILDNGDPDEIVAFMKEHDLVLDGDRLVPASSESKKKHADLASFWDARQLARKILLNSLN